MDESPDSGRAPAQAGRVRTIVHAVIAVVVLAAGLAAGYWFLQEDRTASERPSSERAARLVETTPAEMGSHTISVTAWGQARPKRELSLSPRVGGRVDQVSEALTPGGFLEAGEPLIRLDREPFEVDLRRARTALTQARADLALEQGQQAIAQREFELMDQPVDDAERALMLRQPQLKSAEAAVASAEADVADARRALGDTELTAPFDALVRSTDVAVGGEVDSSTAVAELVGVDTWWIEVAVPASALRWLAFPDGDEAGAVVRLYNEGVWPPGVYREGRVVRLLGELEEDGRLARVLVAVDDPLARDSDAPRLLLGSFLRAEIRGRTLEQAVALEPSWVRPGDTVWVMDDQGLLEIRDLEVAYRDGSQVLVTDGLAEGDRIVTSPLALPAEGMPLRTADDRETGESRNGA